MTDPRALGDDAVLHLDRLGAVILDDVGDGPPPSDLATAALAARDAVARLAIPALTQLTGLVAGVAQSMVAGTTDWNTSLGGTLMAAVDDLRHLAARASQFSDEDGEHLHHRAAELSAYVNEPGAESGSQSSQPSSNLVSQPPLRQPAQSSSVQPAQSSSVQPAQSSAVQSAQAPTSAAPIVPIEALFYAEGPHIVSGGVPKVATDKSELLGRGIDALEHLMAAPLAKPLTVGAIAVVPVETLLYRGRAALERAATIREQIKTSGGTASPAALDEMYDLIGLALKD